MGKNLSPILRREFANLDKDADSRRSAMKALKSYVKELDSKAIPVFLAQVSDTKQPGSLPGDCTISLYEVLARVHGVKIVPMIDKIMASITKTLASSSGSFPLQQACSKVVPAIARYGIDPTTPEERKRHVIFLLCNPLSESLVGCHENLTSGAALCLTALVDSDNWRFASTEMVNKVCQNVAVALEEKSSQTNSYMGLVMALAKHNAKIIEPYARLLVQSGVQMLNSGIVEGNSQKQLSAIDMIDFLMKFLDPWSICSELEVIIEEMEKCQSDQTAYVREAAFTVLQAAKRIGAEEGSRLDRSPGSVTGSNFGRREHRRGNLWDDCDQTPTPTSASPESQTLGSFLEYESLVRSPISARQVPHNQFHEYRNVNRELLSYENGGESDHSARHRLHSGNLKLANGRGNYAETHEFGGFFQRKSETKPSRSATTSPLRRCSHLSEDLIFNTPRKLVHSLQDIDGIESDSLKNHSRQRIRSLSSANFEWIPTPTYGKENEGSNINCEQVGGSSESVASTDDAALQKQILEETPTHTLAFQVKKHHEKKTAVRLVCAISVLTLAVLSPLLWIKNQNKSFCLVPT